MEVIQELLLEQKKNIDFFFENIDRNEWEAVLKACLECPGLIILTGVGKSGIIAEKIAMTLASTGTRAIYLPPTNFLHGDIGVVTAHDLFFLFSKSGESEELLNILPFIKRKGTQTVAVVSEKNSRLSKGCSYTITLPLLKELCPFNLAPTTSTALQLLFGDILSVALMREKRFSLDEYAFNHPLGSIGKKIMLKVEDIMLKGEDTPTCIENQLLKDVIEELSNKKCGCVLIKDEEDCLRGIFTDGDLRRMLQEKGSAVLMLPMKDLMNPSALFVSTEERAWDALKMMQKDPKKWVTVLPVLNDGKLVGILRMHDIINAGISA